jgi:hypothetical protein
VSPRVRRALLLTPALWLPACVAPADLDPTSAGIVADTMASPATLPAQQLAGGAVLPDGRLALADVAAGTVWLLPGDGSPPATLGSQGSEPGQLLQPIGVTVVGDTIVVVSVGNRRVERYSAAGAPWGSSPLAAELFAAPLEVLPSGHVLVSTLGRDSSLARLHAADGTLLQRFGVVLAPTAGELNPGTLKAEIREGRVPEAFRNVALPVPGPGGELWLVLHTEGRIERLAADGTVLTQVTMPVEETTPIREDFFQSNTDPDRPGALFAYILVAAGVADTDGAWFLLAGPATRSAILLRILNDGAIAERLVVAEAPGARLLLRDQARDRFYLVNQQEGLVVRVRRAAN